ncbi:tyrosine-protein kinase-like otk [Anthonomus grandis grandis]|uniref:tyrosine-protein kinase-like otk n=1 Tax=Anthonomus grandis grandis TaxID=2921223 RepID=UPI00216561E2|nr:tyrosine-protein kinase-like otk [Anthonomus grandis grandis]
MSAAKVFVNFFFAIGLYTVFCNADEPYFTKSPKDVPVVVGTSVTLPCEATPGDGIVYYWELNGSKVINTTRRFMQGSDLHITRVDRERDVGEFTCIVEDISRKNPPISSSTASLIFEFIEEPEVVLHEPPKPQEIKNGGAVVLKCHLDASGDVHIKWFRNSRPLSTNSTKLELKKRRLTIKHVDSLDNGVYKCEANNSAGSRKSAKGFALAVEGENSPLIQTIPADQILKKGTTAYFHCSYQRADVLEWYFKESGPLKTKERITVHSNGTLQINDVSEEDVGWYNCVGIKSESTEVPQSYTAEVALAFIEPFTESSFEPPLKFGSEQPVGEGTLFQLTCLEPKSFPLAKKWWQNSAGHTISDRGDIYVDDGRLIITKVKQSDAGKYTCVAENVAGKTEKMVDIVVTTKPTVTQDPVSITVDENDKSVLTCQYSTSFPKYTVVKWRKDGKLLKHEFDETSPSHQRIRVYKHNGTLIIHSTQSSDRGEYICEVITEGFEAVPSQPATISVIEQLRFVPAPVNRKLELDSTGKKIHCKAQGTPPPLVHWEKEGLTPDNFPAHITDMNGTLHFNKVTAADKGKYHCIATNSQGTINASINIDVVVAPRFVVPPKTPLNVNEGDSVMIDCIVEGDPEPTVQWDKNSKMNDLDPKRYRVLENGSLYIKEVGREDQNKYGCTAGSSAGLNRKEVELFVHTSDGFQTVQGDTTVTKAVLITMSVAGAYIVLVIGLMVWCRYRRKSRKLPIGDGKLDNGDMENQELKAAENGVVPGPSKCALNGIETHREGQRSDGAETCNSQASGQSKKSKSSYDKLALSRTLLKDLTLIGRGEFGDVMIAKLSETHVDKATNKRSSSNSAKEEEASAQEEIVKEVSVLVKVLTQTKDENSLAEFKREIDMFSKLSHDNLTKLLGLCREQEPHYLIMEHTEWGDLKKFLLATKTGSPPALTTIQSVAIAHQTSRAMDYLANQRLVHKDLAARNCLITSNLVVKIGLPRMTKEPYSQEYCKHANQIIPLRWLPYEAVYEDEYSTKSDVYSFAVLVWEIFAQGELPHSKINDTSFLGKLKEKKLEWKSFAGTPEALEKIQELCWDVNPQNRPAFGQISTDIKEILKSL